MIIWCMVPDIWSATDRIFWYFGIFFWPFTPLTNQKIKNFKKMKTPGDIIILNMSTNHLRYSSWDTEWERKNFMSFWYIFCHFTPLTTRKIKIFKKWKKHLGMLPFYTCVPKITIIWCMLPEIWNMTDNFLSFWAIFCPFTPLLTLKIKIWNKCKKTWLYYPITHVYHK